MTPRPDIVGIEHDASVSAFRALFADEEYSRIPVYRDNLDNIIGFVFAKDLVTLDGVPGEMPIVPQLLRPVHVVPEGKRVAELLRELQLKQAQSAIVVDEYGGVAGLITIEDVLEQIVGDIEDEYDRPARAQIQRTRRDSFHADAIVRRDHLAEITGFSMPSGRFETLGGLLLALFQRVPETGDQIIFRGWKLQVIEMNGPRIVRVQIDTPTRNRGSQ